MGGIHGNKYIFACLIFGFIIIIIIIPFVIVPILKKKAITGTRKGFQSLVDAICGLLPHYSWLCEITFPIYSCLSSTYPWVALQLQEVSLFFPFTSFTPYSL